MKKALIAVMALASVATAADVGYVKDTTWVNDVTFTGNPVGVETILLSTVGANWSNEGSIYWGGTNSTINLTVDANYTPWRIKTADNATINSLTLNFTGNHTLSVPSNSDANFAFTNVVTLNINFGSGGLISTGQVIDLGSDDLNLNFTSTTDITKVKAGLYTRDLMVSTGTIWYSDNYLKEPSGTGKINFRDSGLDAAGYTFKGFVDAKNSSSLAAGEYALALDGTQKYQLVAHIIPEPTTATLSLLALAGLAARRRRK